MPFIERTENFSFTLSFDMNFKCIYWIGGISETLENFQKNINALYNGRGGSDGALETSDDGVPLK